MSGEKLGLLAGKEATLKTDLGEISFDRNATANIQANAAENIKISMESIDCRLVSYVSENDKLYNLSMKAGENEVLFGTEHGGNAVITVPCNLETDQDCAVYYINENGAETQVAAEFHEENGTVSFMTTHFSLYKLIRVPAETCTLTFDCTGGEDVAPIVRAKGRKVILPNCSKSDAVFDGWKNKKGEIYFSGASYQMMEDELFIAQWREKTDINFLNEKISLSFETVAYTGEEQRASVIIDGLEENSDYQVIYSDNLIDAGQVTVEIKGIGEYTGSIFRYYEIMPKSILECREFLKLSETNYVYDGTAKEPEVIIEGLALNLDYTIEYKNNVEPGQAEIIITGQGNYAKTLEISFVINGLSMENWVISYEDSFEYTGQEICPQVVVEGMTEAVDYVVDYTDNLNTGTGIITITGKGVYAGSVRREFEIIPKSLAAYEEILILSETSFVYDGTAKKPDVIITGLTEGLDYTVVYENNVNRGKATVMVNGCGNYTGQLTAFFDIGLITIENVELSYENSFEYTGQEIKPMVIIEGMKEGIDYTVEYIDNQNVGDGKLIVTGIGNYVGSIERTFEIIPKSLLVYKECSGLSQNVYIYDGIEKKPEVVITGLEAGKDYEVLYENNINPGDAKVFVYGCGNYTDVLTLSFVIKPISIEGVSLVYEKIFEYTGKEICPAVVLEGMIPERDYIVDYANNKNVGIGTVIVMGIGHYEGRVEVNFEITPKSLIDLEEIIRLSSDYYVYDGSAKEPNAIIEGLELGSDYIVSYDNNIKPGEAKVYIKGCGNYNGSVTRIFKIVCEHSYEVLDEKNATCTEEGERDLICKICGDIIREIIPAKGHQNVTDEMVPATCISEGKKWEVIA